jgi:mono/diheme cytochrome c family protein
MKILSKLGMLLLAACLSLTLAACGSDSNDSPTPVPSVEADAFAGGLVWDNWTKVDAGGTGELPEGAVNKDFVRCKACHGWDAKGLAGGYVRRSASATRPNPEPGVDLTSAAATLTLDAVFNSGGRAFSEENQQMPAYDNNLAGLTDQQAEDVLEFLLNGPKIGDYASLDTSVDPVAYTFNDVSLLNGKDLYASQCQGCHGAADSTDDTATNPALGSYFVRDGKYSEGFHKSVYGIPDTSMTRAAMGELSGEQVADILAYIQLTLEPSDAFVGGLAWDNWTKVDAGGTGALPTGADTNGFLRCKACHGWDAKGLAGGYVRRSANDTRPNPEPGVDLTAADAMLSLAAIDNTDGRAFSVENQTMPAYDVAGGLTVDQTEDLLKFLVVGPKIGDYATLDTSVDPVAYTFTNADKTNGATLYSGKCAGCHGAADSTDDTATNPALGSYYVRDGKYSEGFHKTVYGIPGTSMTRAAMGELSGQQVADIHAYIQETLDGGSTTPDPTPTAPTTVVYPASIGDVTFDHTNHSGSYGLGCSDCHSTTPDPGHSFCQSCHDATAGAPDSNTCSNCHGN